jgi:hypothetical protein
MVVPLGVERSSRLAERLCLAILESKADDRLSNWDIFAAVPLAIARYIASTVQAGDRYHRVAAAEAIFRHLGRTLLSVSYDRAMLGSM